MKLFLSVCLSFVFLSQAIAADKISYQRTIQGKSCKHQERSQQLDCRYKIGKSLDIEIAGIGLPDTSIVFYKSDFNGDFYGSYGIRHDCIIVKNTDNLFDVAFISPSNGKIYKTWMECQEGF